MSFTSLLTQTASVRRPTVTHDSIGGESVIYQTVTTALPCLIQPRGGQERAMSGTTGVSSTHIMFCGAGADVREIDTVIVDGVEYDVKFVANQMGHHLEIDLWERRPPRG